MRTHLLGSTATTAATLVASLAVLLGVAVGCGNAASPGTDSPSRTTGEPSQESSTVSGQPEVRVFALLDRGALRPAQRRDRVVELTGASTLEALVPPQAFEDDQLPELPELPSGARRFAAITSGCQQQDPPAIQRVGARWRLHFEDNGTRCVVPDHYVVVWDVAG